MLNVAIVGCASPPSSEPIPFGDPEWEVWGINNGYLSYPGAYTRWFELHGRTPLTQRRRNADHWDRLEAMKIPVYYLRGDAPTSNARLFPIDAAIAAGRDYFVCTNAYQIALALSEGATRIAMFNAPLHTNREIVVERACVSWWLGLAEGRGVQVSVHHHSAIGLLAHPYRYAWDDYDERLATYAATEQAAYSIERWLPLERERLGIRHVSVEYERIEVSQ